MKKKTITSQAKHPLMYAQNAIIWPLNGYKMNGCVYKLWTNAHILPDRRNDQ